jgi:hypothetical protein
VNINVATHPTPTAAKKRLNLLKVNLSDNWFNVRRAAKTCPHFNDYQANLYLIAMRTCLRAISDLSAANSSSCQGLC